MSWFQIFQCHTAYCLFGFLTIQQSCDRSLKEPVFVIGRTVVYPDDYVWSIFSQVSNSFYKHRCHISGRSTTNVHSGQNTALVCLGNVLLYYPPKEQICFAENYKTICKNTCFHSFHAMKHNFFLQVTAPWADSFFLSAS